MILDQILQHTTAARAERITLGTRKRAKLEIVSHIQTVTEAARPKSSGAVSIARQLMALGVAAPSNERGEG